VTKIRVLLVHNYYQNSGGEDIVFAAEKKLLAEHGHEVVEYTDDNSRLNTMNQFSAAANMIWSRSSYRSVKKIIQTRRPALVHFHNTFLMISPSAYYACREAGVPVTQTLHNYRLLCPAATFYRASTVCEKCLGSFFAWNGVRYACYRDSKFQTAGLAAMLSFHKILGTWKNLASVYIALTDFSRKKFIEGGLPASKIAVKPNFVAPDPGFGAANGDYALFAGRLASEKGVLTMLEAWKALPTPIPLKIVGDGPVRDEVLKFIKDSSLRAEYLGATSHDQVIALMKDARFLIFPSEWYEGFPLVIAEAFACGLPIVSSQIGGMAEIIEDKITGVFFKSGSAEDLAEKILWVVNHPVETTQMRLNARKTYLEKYSEEAAYKNILRVYNIALGRTES